MTLKKQSSASPFKSQGNFIPAPLKTGLPLRGGEITGTRAQKGVEAGDSGLALLQEAPPGPPGPGVLAPPAPNSFTFLPV